VNTNCAGSLRNGKRENPIAWTRKEAARIRAPLPVRSRTPPQTGERMIVSTAGMNGTREISEYDAPRERSCIGRNAQMMPVGPKARAVERLIAIRWFVRDPLSFLSSSL